MTRSSSSRIMRKRSEKLREKAKRMALSDNPEKMKDPEIRRKTFEAIDNAAIAIDNEGKVQIMYGQNNNEENKDKK